MENELSTLPERAKDKHKIHADLFKKLRKKPPKNLDYIMQKLHDEVFAETNCLNCANCCRTTGPLFTDKDIVRIAKHLKLKPQAFIDTYLQIDKENDYVLQHLPCAFLGADNYCSIYDVRPKACREFPHTNRRKFQQISHLTLKNVAICPAAFQVVEKLNDQIK